MKKEDCKYLIHDMLVVATENILPPKTIWKMFASTTKSVANDERFEEILRGVRPIYPNIASNLTQLREGGCDEEVVEFLTKYNEFHSLQLRVKLESDTSNK